MNSLNTDTAAREQETMMQQGFGMLSGKFSVLSRLVMMAVLTMVFGVVGFVATAEAVSNSYHTDYQSAGSTYGGMSVTYTTCGNDVAVGDVGILQYESGGFPGTYDCADEQLNYSGSGVQATFIFTTPYAVSTDIQGETLWAYLRDRDSSDGAISIALGYVSGGSFTSFGSVIQMVLNGDRQTFTMDFSGVSGTAPAGSVLAIQFTNDSGQADRAYFGTADDSTGSIRFTVDETTGCTETATVNAVNPGAITGATTITATLGGSGGSSPQIRWSIDGGGFSSWANSGATLTPPAGNSGTVIIEAQATGSCGTVTDPSPANTTYDTACSPTANTLTCNAGQTLSGSNINLNNTLNIFGTQTERYTVSQSGGGSSCDVSGAIDPYVDPLNFNVNGGSFTDAGTYLTSAGSDAGYNGPGDAMNSGNVLEYTFNVTQAGTYRLYLYTSGLGNPGNYSVYFGVDGVMVEEFEPPSNGWAWSSTDKSGGTMDITLSAGSHTLTFDNREAGTPFGGIYLSLNNNNPPNASSATPTGGTPNGGGSEIDPTNCSAGSTTYYGPDAISSIMADTSSLTNNDVYDLHVTAQDSCGSALAPVDCTFTFNACSESTPSSINFNSTTSAFGDFSGASMVTPVDLGSLEFRITEGSGGGAPFDQLDSDFSNGNHVQLSSVSSNWTDTAGASWCVQQGATASNGPGPSVGNPDPYLYHEASGTSTDVCQNGFALGDTVQIESNLVDAGAYALTLDFDYNFTLNGSTGACVYVDVWDGAWNNDVTGGAIFCGDNNDTWDPASIDLDALGFNSGNIRLRLRVTNDGSGTSWHYDTAFDNLHVYGPSRSVEVERLAWNPDPQEAGAVLTNGSSYNLYARGTDPECGTLYTATGNQAFTWSSCIETATLTLNPITDPITGNVTVTATGTATGIQVGTSPSPTNASGWVYTPTQDDNTTTASFYATGAGTCGPLTASQLNVATNTMVAPTVANFIIPANVTDTAAPLDVPITTFNAVDNVAVTGYMITIDDAVAPAAGAAGWTGAAPTSVAVPGYASYTLYAWAKDAAGNVSLSASAPVTMSNCTPTVTALNISVVSNPINYPTTGSVINVVPTGGTVTGTEWSANGGSNWFASGTTYTAPVQTNGSVNITGRATEDTCSSQISANNEPVALNYDTRTPGIEAGSAAAVQTAVDTISVTMPYLGDVNGDATFQVDYKLVSSGSWTNGTPTTDAGGTPYTQNISGLPSPETYDVRMTYADVDGVISGTVTQQVVVVMAAWADNVMLHNSLRFTGTVKHGGNWGTPGNYAGGIVCSTCHDKETGNIKRIKAIISFPDGGTMPGGGTSATVSLQTVAEGTSDLGNDATAPRSSSNAICEACHTADLTQINGTKQHAADQAANSNHFNQTDCIVCHEHKRGFEATCDSCHGNPPTVATLGGPNGLDNSSNAGAGTGSDTAGKHDLHANTLGYLCVTCHNGGAVGGEMPNGGNINLGFVTPGTPGGNYDGRSAGSYFNDVNTTISTGDTRGCSTVYCHGSATPTWSNTGTAVCGSCHGDATGAPLPVANDGDLSGATTGKKVGKHSQHIARGYSCSLCHNGAGDGTAKHVDGTNDIVFDGALAGGSAAYTAGTSTCSNLSCHGSQVWDTASAALACDSCHGYPPTASTGHAAGATAVDHAKFSANGVTSNHSECNTCHGFSESNGATLNAVNGGDDYQLSFHQDGNIEMNGWATDSGQDAQYQQSNFGCAKACHGNDATHQLSDSALPIQLGRYGGGACDGCHNGTGTGATKVNAASSHSINSTGFSCEDCHTAHGSGTIEVPNNTTLGINYSANGEAGISLGGAGTTGTTEAEICWNCHDGKGVSEWGTNTDTNAGGANYNAGSLNQSNWTTATWTSANFAYKTGRIQSTHSVNSSGTSTVSGGLNSTTETVDNVANIRCSYCHDVHDLNTLASDNSSGKPYLRGTWMGNPYKEDGAPQAGTNYTDSNNWGQVPRGSNATNMQLGGYWIDQNSGNPTSGWTLSSSAGLCTLCHGTNVDTMDQKTGENLWVGTNGHSNAVIGGSGSAKFNVFDARGGQSGNTNNPYQHYSGFSDPADNGSYGFRSNNSSAFQYQPILAGGNTRPRMFNTDNWGVDETGALETQYHSFSCSKCHNPHASRLPKLMITNCLDTKHNTWDDSYQLNGSNGSNNTNRSISNWTSAQNCHRLGGTADGSGPEPVDSGAQSGVGNGWNTVTPWRVAP